MYCFPPSIIRKAKQRSCSTAPGAVFGDSLQAPTLLRKPGAISSPNTPNCEARLNTLLKQLTLVAQPVPSPISIRLPDKDQPIFLAARAAKASHLLTGDLKHFGPAVNKPHLSDGIVIQTVAEFLSSL